MESHGESIVVAARFPEESLWRMLLAGLAN
jgi:hypothetical protein